MGLTLHELIRGNYILSPCGSLTMVDCIYHDHGVITSLDDVIYPPNQLAGLRITEDILSKCCGFRTPFVTAGWCRHGEIALRVLDYEVLVEYMGRRLPSIRFVHTLQNLYYYLSGGTVLDIENLPYHFESEK